MMRKLRIVAVCVALGIAFAAGRFVAPPAADAQAMTLSHFRCYTANFTGTTPLQAPVALRDQFGVSQAIVTRPELFCTPVVKRLLKSEPKPFPQPADHLTCYAAESKVIGDARVGANQLGRVQVRDLAPRLLCVPTHKFEPKGVPVPVPTG